jgi:hypothetical protein
MFGQILKIPTKCTQKGEKTPFICERFLSFGQQNPKKNTFFISKPFETVLGGGFYHFDSWDK